MVVAAVVLVLVCAALVACGEDDNPSGDEVAERVADAVRKPGMVYHSVADDNSEVWIDAENAVFRRREATSSGELISVGEGWVRTGFNAFDNKIEEEDTSPQGELRPRIDDPMITWLEALGALAFGREIEVIGKTVSDGQEVLAVETRVPIAADGQPTGRTLVGRVEVDPDTYFPVAFERREEVPAEQTPSQARVRIVYTTAELIPRDTLPDDFFDKSVVEAQLLTTEESIAKAREIGLTPYWLGEVYDGAFGQLALPPTDAVFTDTANESAEMHYALIAPSAGPLLDAVVVRLGMDPNAFVPPQITELGGDLPEQPDDVSVRGGTATIYTSILSPADLGCGEDECPGSDAQLYRRLVLVIGDTAVQIEVMARVDPNGVDLNGYNSVAGLTALAEALTEAMAP